MSVFSIRVAASAHCPLSKSLFDAFLCFHRNPAPRAGQDQLTLSLCSRAEICTTCSANGCSPSSLRLYHVKDGRIVGLYSAVRRLCDQPMKSTTLQFPLPSASTLVRTEYQCARYILSWRSAVEIVCFSATASCIVAASFLTFSSVPLWDPSRRIHAPTADTFKAIVRQIGDSCSRSSKGPSESELHYTHKTLFSAQELWELNGAAQRPSERKQSQNLNNSLRFWNCNDSVAKPCPHGGLAN